MKNKGKFQLWWQMFYHISLEILMKLNINMSYKS